MECWQVCISELIDFRPNLNHETSNHSSSHFHHTPTGAATCFYAFVGFDSIATSGEEARDPSYSIPRATLLSMAIVTIGYMMVGTALTLVVPYWEINPTAALPEAFSSRGVPWAKYVIRSEDCRIILT